ncbi:MAG TPA: hypothetical protein VNO81_01655 [Candidatus Nitrosotenuis sp.]|jgi:hypothetical protein|nr:hypothetical protein [Candidatus Nitrosotenuis sp.]
MRPRPPGYILLLVLVLCGISFALLLYSAPGSDLFRLAWERQEHQNRYEAAAAAQNAAISGLMYNPDLPAPPPGSDSQTPSLQSLQVDLADVQGVLTFQPGNPPYSTSNYGNQTAATGWGVPRPRTVPAGQVHLVAVGRKGDRDTMTALRQALVQPFYQYLYEDFNADGQGSQPRLPWTYLPGTSGHLIQDSYMFLGSPIYQHNKIQIAQTGLPIWQDFDLEAHVAYYGNTNFAFCFRLSPAFEGYMLQMQPRIGLEQVDGVDVTCTALISQGQDTIPYPQAEQYIDDPIFQPQVDLTEQPAEWTLRVSVQGTSVWLSARDPQSGEFRPMGQPFDLTQLSPKLQEEGYPALFTSGGIGFWSGIATCVGVTNVIVNKRGEAMIYIPAQWRE